MRVSLETVSQPEINLRGGKNSENCSRNQPRSGGMMLGVGGRGCYETLLPLASVELTARNPVPEARHNLAQHGARRRRRSAG